jgi:hypothetical protein
VTDTRVGHGGDETDPDRLDSGEADVSRDHPSRAQGSTYLDIVSTMEVRAVGYGVEMGCKLEVRV